MTVPVGTGMDGMATQWAQPTGYNPPTVAPVVTKAEVPDFDVEDAKDTSDYDGDGDGDVDSNLLPPTDLSAL